MSIPKTALHLFFSFFYLFFLSCSKENRPTPVRTEMQDLYQPASELFTYVWSPSAFFEPGQRKHIQSLLKTLSHDFHRVGKAADLRSSDPGIATTLDVTKRLLSDAEKRFQDGRYEYARWRLKGLIHTCIGCHTRTQPSAPFLGAAPIAEPKIFDSAFNAVEFLIASRQFKEASERLYILAERCVEEEALNGRLLPVLRLWLLLQIRVTDAQTTAGLQLQSLYKKAPRDLQPLLANWRNELKKNQHDPWPPSPVDTAEKLLAPVRINILLSRDDWNLVSTLRATSMLHLFLENPNLPTTARSKASLLLAVSYQHINIPTFSALRDLYLEYCIRTFPGTKEAQEAFTMYEWNTKVNSSGSGGIHIDETDKKLMNELRELSQRL